MRRARHCLSDPISRPPTSSTGPGARWARHCRRAARTPSSREGARCNAAGSGSAWFPRVQTGLVAARCRGMASSAQPQRLNRVLSCDPEEGHRGRGGTTLAAAQVAAASVNLSWARHRGSRLGDARRHGRHQRRASTSSVRPDARAPRGVLAPRPRREATHRLRGPKERKSHASRTSAIPSA